MNGKGILNNPDGKKYQGDFVNDKKEGIGVFIWKDGRKYAGEWKEGK